MGGTSSPRCETALWRGHLVCKHSIPKLEAWAKATGHVLVQPIQGCYHPGLGASAGTHDRGGVYDIEMDGYSFADFNATVNHGRHVELVTFGRWWEGNHHIHLLDPACPDLAPSAEDQMEQFRRGETGLVGADRDPWDRSTVAAIMKTYDARHNVKPASTGGVHRAPSSYTIPKGGTLGAAAVILGASVGALASWNHIPNANVVHAGQVITAPPSSYKAPAPTSSPKPSPKPAPKPSPKPAPKASSKPAPKPSSKPKPVAKPASKSNAVDRRLLYVGKHGASVYTYEPALRAYVGASTANRFGLTAARAADGYFGTATAAATRAAYQRLGVTPYATSPGPFLLRVLHLRAIA